MPEIPGGPGPEVSAPSTESSYEPASPSVDTSASATVSVQNEPAPVVVAVTPIPEPEPVAAAPMPAPAAPPQPPIAGIPHARWERDDLPNLREDFYNARRPEFPPDEGLGPVSEIEAERLKEKLSKPVMDGPPPPGGDPLNTDSAKERLQYIQERLGKVKGIAKDRFQREAADRSDR